MERDSFSYIIQIRKKNFNSHAHVERDYDDAEIYHYKTNFNSHAHVERDSERLLWHNQTAISTHTLTWSVTFDFYQ